MDLQVERLAWGGLGLARDTDGRLALLRAPLALFPGERVRADVRWKSRHGEGLVEAWLEPSPERCAPECPYAERCGGCELWGAGGHMQTLKRAMVADLLGRHLPEAPDWTWHPAPQEAKRHRIQLHWQDRTLGFHQRQSHVLVPVRQCPAAAPVLSDAIPKLAEALEARRLPTRPQRWELATGTPADQVWAVDEGGTAWHWADGVWQPAPGDEGIFHRHQNFVLGHRPGGFFQVCPPWALAAISERMAAWDLRGSTLFDLYGGVGLFSALACQRFNHRVLVEWDESAVGWATRNLAAMDLPTTCLAADVDGWLTDDLGTPTDVVVLDPPRTGLSADVTRKLQTAQPRTLVLMGCDGAAFCRDAKRLAPRWHLEALAVIDLFPLTHHVECVGLFRN